MNKSLMTIHLLYNKSIHTRSGDLLDGEGDGSASLGNSGRSEYIPAPGTELYGEGGSRGNDGSVSLCS